MATCQNNFWNGYSGLPAFGLDRLRNNDDIDIHAQLTSEHRRAGRHLSDPGHSLREYGPPDHHSLDPAIRARGRNGGIR